MISATLLIYVQAAAGRDKYGQPVFGKEVTHRVCPVKLMFSDQHTTVRTDSSGTHGGGIERASNVVLLAKPKSGIKVNDVITIGPHKVKVTGAHDRYDTQGNLAHIELHCDTWK